MDSNFFDYSLFPNIVHQHQAILAIITTKKKASTTNR